MNGQDRSGRGRDERGTGQRQTRKTLPPGSWFHFPQIVIAPMPWKTRQSDILGVVPGDWAKLTGTAAKVYVVMCMFASREANLTWLALTNIAKFVGRDVRSADRAVRELAGLGLIMKAPVRQGRRSYEYLIAHLATDAQVQAMLDRHERGSACEGALQTLMSA